MSKKLKICLIVTLLAVLALCAVACKDSPATAKVTFNVLKTGGNAELSAPADGKEYRTDETLTLTVTPDDGFVAAVEVNGTKIEPEGGKYSFVAQKETTIIVSFVETASITSEFDKKCGEVAVSAPRNGKYYEVGENVEFTVSAKEGYLVSMVTVNGVSVSPNDGKYTFAAAKSTKIKAEFLAANSPKAAVKTEYDKTLGSVVLSDPLNGENYLEGEFITVTATPKENSVLEVAKVNNKTVKDVKNGKFTFVAKSENVVTVTFALKVNVTTEYDETRGSLKLSAPANDGKYAIGETVTGTVSAKSGYILSLVRVNDDVAKVDDKGNFTFKVAENTVVAASFVKDENMSETVFGTIKGKVRFEGKYSYAVADHPDYDATMNLQTVFGGEYISQLETDAETGEVYYDIVYGSYNGKLALVTHLIDNTMKFTVATQDYADFYNPFDSLSASDFKLLSDGCYALIDLGKAATAAPNVTGYNESIAEFYVYVENGKAVRLHIKTQPVDRGEITYVSTYELTISDHGVAEIEPSRINPWERVAAHEALQTALENAAAANYYTIRHQGHEPGYVEPDGGETRPGYGDTDYKVYVTNDMIYDSYKGEEHGFKAMGAYVYPFDFESSADKIVLRDPVNVADISELQAKFDAFNVEIMKYLGKIDGYDVFSLHDPNMATAVVPFFGEGNENQYYSFAVNLKISVKDGVLAKVEFTYKTYGITEEVTLTYDFDTEFDVLGDLKLDFEKADKTSVFDSFNGQYRDSENGHFCEVSNKQFIFDGVVIENLQFHTADSTFTGTWRGIPVTIIKFSSKELMIVSDDATTVNTTMVSIDTDVVEIPEKFRGVWVIDNDEEDLHYKISVQSYVVFVNGEEGKVLSYKQSEGVAIALGEDSVYLMEVEEEDGEVYVYVMIKYADTSFVKFFAKKTDESAGIEIPADFVGTYMSEDGATKVVITYSSITINGGTFVPSSYTQSGGFTGTYTDRNGVSVSGYTVQFYGFGGTTSKDELLIGTTSDNVRVSRVSSLNANYVGTWKSTPNDDGTVEYVVRITDTSITVNGKEIAFTFDPEYGYAISLEGNPYTVYLLYAVNKYGNPYIAMYDDNEADPFLKVLFKQNAETVPEEIVGLWTGRTADETTTVAVKITKNGELSFKLNDGELQSVNAEYDFDNDMFEFEFDGMTWYVIYNGETLSVYRTDSEFEIVLEQQSALDITEEFFGTWTSSDGKTQIVITADSLRVKLNGGEFVEITKAAINDYKELEFRYEGSLASLSTSYGEGTLMFFIPDLEIYVSLIKGE